MSSLFYGLSLRWYFSNGLNVTLAWDFPAWDLTCDIGMGFAVYVSALLALLNLPSAEEKHGICVYLRGLNVSYRKSDRKCGCVLHLIRADY